MSRMTRDDWEERIAALWADNTVDDRQRIERMRALAAAVQDIDPDRAAQLIVQHASTLRNIGRVDEAITMLRNAPEHPSTGAAPKVFLALALHSAGRHDEALRVAVEAIEPTLPRYRRSVTAYAQALTEH